MRRKGFGTLNKFNIFTTEFNVNFKYLINYDDFLLIKMILTPLLYYIY